MQHNGGKMKNKKSLILSLSLIVIIAAVYFVYVINAQNKPILNSSFNEYEQISASYETMSQNLKQQKTYEKTELELINKINELNILQNIQQEEIIIILNDILKTCKINPGKISFSEIYTVNINELNSEESESENAVTETETEVVEAQAMTVNLEFSSTYDNLVSFIDEVQDSDKDISISNIRIINQEEGEEVQCQITLNFFALPL